MKKQSHRVKFLSAAILIAGFFVVKGVYAVELVDAANCAYTGNSSDYCNASDGTHNLKVTNCRPGETSCGYNPPTTPQPPVPELEP
jgi:hypothetical protein